MPDVALVQSASANGTATPATLTRTGVTVGNLLICLIAALGTSPTIATPTGDTWVQVQKTADTAFTFAMYILPNAGAGSHTPSAVLGGTVTGWIMSVFEFSNCGANCGLQGSSLATAAVASSAPNQFPTNGLTLSSELFVYAVARATATITPTLTFPSPLVNWSASVLPQAGVQGMSLDFFWASGLGQGIGSYPVASASLGSSVERAAIPAWFNTLARQPSNNDNVNGNAGLYVPVQYAGMIGG